jgi:hypothetical protein
MKRAFQKAEEAVTAAKESDENADLEEALLVLEKARSPEGPKQIDLLLLDTAQKLATLLPEGTILAYSQDHGLGWRDAGGWDVYIGADLTSFDQKFSLYQGLSQGLAGQGITPAIISVEYLDTPYYRLER